jgi:hypothetical protein
VTLSARYGRRCDSREQADDIVFDGVLFVEHKVTLNSIEVYSVSYSSISLNSQYVLLMLSLMN